MKPYLMLIAVPLLASCATTPAPASQAGATTALGRALISGAIEHKCKSELPANHYFKMTNAILSAKQQTSLATGVCECVSTHAPNYIDVKTLASAAVNPQIRAEVAGNVVRQTLSQCAQEYIQTQVNSLLGL